MKDSSADIIQSIMESIFVSIRVRPLCKQESSKGSPWKLTPKTIALSSEVSSSGQTYHFGILLSITCPFAQVRAIFLCGPHLVIYCHYLLKIHVMHFTCFRKIAFFQLCLACISQSVQAKNESAFLGYCEHGSSEGSSQILQIEFLILSQKQLTYITITAMREGCETKSIEPEIGCTENRAKTQNGKA